MSQTPCPHAGGWAQDCCICLTAKLMESARIAERLRAVLGQLIGFFDMLEAGGPGGWIEGEVIEKARAALEGSK